MWRPFIVLYCNIASNFTNWIKLFIVTNFSQKRRMPFFNFDFLSKQSVWQKPLYVFFPRGINDNLFSRAGIMNKRLFLSKGSVLSIFNLRQPDSNLSLSGVVPQFILDRSARVDPSCCPFRQASFDQRFPRRIAWDGTIASVHLRRDDAETAAVEVELDVGMIGEKRHWAGAVGNALGDHQGREPHAEGAVVFSCLPD